jgi:mono/diheme cytochrome c family protein
MQAKRALHSRANHSTVLFAVLATIALVFIAAAQEKVANVKTVPITYTNPASGSEMYSVYCAVCHGATGNGNGPAASVFTKPPTNLTMLARNNNGKYPAELVKTVLKFGTPVRAHGNIQMPVWNTLFRSLNPTDDSGALTQLRIHNLVEYGALPASPSSISRTIQRSARRHTVRATSKVGASVWAPGSDQSDRMPSLPSMA